MTTRTLRHAVEQLDATQRDFDTTRKDFLALQLLLRDVHRMTQVEAKMQRLEERLDRAMTMDEMIVLNQMQQAQMLRNRDALEAAWDERREEEIRYLTEVMEAGEDIYGENTKDKMKYEINQRLRERAELVAEGALPNNGNGEEGVTRLEEMKERTEARNDVIIGEIDTLRKELMQLRKRTNNGKDRFGVQEKSRNYMLLADKLNRLSTQMANQAQAVSRAYRDAFAERDSSRGGFEADEDWIWVNEHEARSREASATSSVSQSPVAPSSQVPEQPTTSVPTFVTTTTASDNAAPVVHVDPSVVAFVDTVLKESLYEEEEREKEVGVDNQEEQAAEALARRQYEEGEYSRRGFSAKGELDCFM